MATGRMKYDTKDPATGKDAKEFGDTIRTCVFKDKKSGDTVLGRLFFHQGKSSTPLKDRRFTEVHMYKQYPDELRQAMAIHFVTQSAAGLSEMIYLVQKMDDGFPQEHNPMLLGVSEQDRAKAEKKAQDTVEGVGLGVGVAVDVGLTILSFLL